MRRQWSSKPGIGALAAMIVSLAGAGYSAHAGFDRHAARAGYPAQSRGFEADDHFPGAALLYAEADEAAGSTGTVALPALPANARNPVPGPDASIHPAAPFRLRGTSLDKARALQCLTTAIYYEAAAEPDEGQSAVAQVILNRVRHPSFPGSVCGVVYQGSEKWPCQFSFACDGALARVPAQSAWDRARRAAARALAGYVFTPVGLATHYHTYAVTPAWNRRLVMTGMFGAHLFHRWTGWWGTPAAFSRVYAGGEPLPGPHTPVPPAAPIASFATALLATAPLSPPPVQPEREDSGAIRDQYAETAEAQILDRWRDVGKPLR
jgi:hypothetical protein